MQNKYKYCKYCGVILTTRDKLAGRAVCEKCYNQLADNKFTEKVIEPFIINMMHEIKKQLLFQEIVDSNKNVYGWYFKSYLGFLLDNPRCIAGIVNIDATVEAPDALAQQMSDMLVSCRAGAEGTTKIYMHPGMLGKLGKFKENHLQVVNSDKAIDRRVMSWDGVEIVESYNFSQGKESAITL